MIDAWIENNNVVFLSVQTVFEGYDENTFEKLAVIQKKYDLQISFGHDGGDDGKSRSKIIIHYQTAGTPWFMFIDKRTTIVFRYFYLPPATAVEFF
jgi:hypothetical protein